MPIPIELRTQRVARAREDYAEIGDWELVALRRWLKVSVAFGLFGAQRAHRVDDGETQGREITGRRRRRDQAE